MRKSGRPRHLYSDEVIDFGKELSRCQTIEAFELLCLDTLKSIAQHRVAFGWQHQVASFAPAGSDHSFVITPFDYAGKKANKGKRESAGKERKQKSKEIPGNELADVSVHHRVHRRGRCN